MMRTLNKKADASMWWIIIGAVIALVVLIILLVLFTGKTGKLEGGLLSCDGKGGKCGLVTECTANGGTISSAFECPTGLQCCFSTLGLKKGLNAACTSNAECGSNYCRGLETGSSSGLCSG